MEFRIEGYPRQVANVRMIHRHHFHLLAITQKISACSNRITIHNDVVAILNGLDLLDRDPEQNNMVFTIQRALKKVA